MIRKILYASALATTLLSLQMASAETFTITSWTGAKHPFSVNYADFIETVETATNGDMEFELHVGGALLPVKAVLEGIRDGVADIGNNIGAYTPADLPINNLLNDVAFAGSNSMAAGFAMTEFTLFNADARQEWDNHNVVFINGWSTPVYYLGCVADVKTFADLSGKKIRTAGGAHVEWVKFAGGVPVSVPFSDVYSGLQRGSLDCVMMNAADMGEGFQIGEVAKSYVMLPMGTHISGVQYLFNKDRWSGLTTEQRELLLRNFAIQLVRFQTNYEVLAKKGMQFAIDHKVEVIEPDATIIKAFAEFKDTYYGNLPKLTEEKRGIPAEQAQELITGYQATYDKWVGLLADVDLNDEAALVALVEKEIYSKLDPASFGL